MSFHLALFSFSKLLLFTGLDSFQFQPFSFPLCNPKSLSLSLSLPTYSPFNVFHSPTTNSIFVSLLTLNQALFSYQFETLKLHAFSLPTSHQTAPDHTLGHFFTRMLDTMNSSGIKMVTCK